MFATIAHAMAPAGEAANPPAGGLMSTLMLVVPMILIFYFLLIRPQSKRAKEHQNFLDNLKKGDDVITSGGLYGKIVGLADQAITIEIADKVRVRISRNQVASYQKPETTTSTVGPTA